MALQSGRGGAMLSAVILNLFAGLQSVIAVSYTVGDAGGWNLGNNYTTWAEKYKFAVGDTVVFNYNQASHSVLQVSQPDYQACNINNALKSYSSGKDTVTLKDPSSYFVCGTPGHCQTGMKVAITTSSTPTTPTTPANPAPSNPSPGGTPSVHTPPSSTSPTSSATMLQQSGTALLLLSPFAVAIPLLL
ncbi:hypothetical protein O6H91_01G077600 [Diphasiastrum complanatum]|uniref:Uncharacterized protein n=1 Tax=Diphasiastrum complanatum TaxID=34168 RepID=A0ACC2ESM0_DIPCM|nr:hypothetical protein O6H91_01G077600 [Diphasiastrum complanatum]